MLTDWLAHVPKEVIAKNFRLPGDLRAFDKIPEHELYIFPCMHFLLEGNHNLLIDGVSSFLAIPPPDDPKEDMVVPNDSPIPYTFKFSQLPALQKPGGTVKIVDSRTFKASKTIAAAEVNIEPGSMR